MAPVPYFFEGLMIAFFIGLCAFFGYHLIIQQGLFWYFAAFIASGFVIGKIIQRSVEGN